MKHIRAAREGEDVAPEHKEIYSEFCQQAMVAVLTVYRDMGRTTMFRELPVGLQLNAVMTGAFIGGLVPTLVTVRPDAVADLVAALQERMPLIAAEARRRAEEIMKA